MVSRVSEDETKNVLSYPSHKPKRREKYVDAPGIFQLIICLIFCLACLTLLDILLHGSGPGVGGGLVCIDCFLLTLVIVNIGLTLVKPRAGLRRISSYCSWGAFLLYVILSVIVAMR